MTLLSPPDHDAGLKGWWVGAKYYPGLEQFIWIHTFRSIPLNDANWGVRRQPYAHTCLWLMQSPSYAYNFENVNCTTTSAFVCEIELPQA